MYQSGREFNTQLGLRTINFLQQLIEIQPTGYPSLPLPRTHSRCLRRVPSVFYLSRIWTSKVPVAGASYDCGPNWIHERIQFTYPRSVVVDHD